MVLCCYRFFSQSNKMISFLELLDFKSLDYGKRICIWKGNGWIFH